MEYILLTTVDTHLNIHVYENYLKSMLCNNDNKTFAHLWITELDFSFQLSGSLIIALYNMARRIWSDFISSSFCSFVSPAAFFLEDILRHRLNTTQN